MTGDTGLLKEMRVDGKRWPQDQTTTLTYGVPAVGFRYLVPITEPNLTLEKKLLPEAGSHFSSFMEISR